VIVQIDVQLKDLADRLRAFAAQLGTLALKGLVALLVFLVLVLFGWPR
jgi:hypothetical protein